MKRLIVIINHFNIKRATALVVALTVVMMGLVGCTNEKNKDKLNEHSIATNSDVVLYKDYEDIVLELKDKVKEDTNISMWYKSDDDLEYLQSAADEFHNKYGIKVSLKQYTDTSLLEDINRANSSDKDDAPDLFLIANHDVMRAALAGVADVNNYFSEGFITENYTKTTLDSLTYNNKIIGYPIYFDTTILVYDSTQTTAPDTFDDILEFSNTLEYETNNKRVLMWELNDPFIDYLFIGAYSDLFGENGDKVSEIDILSDNAIKAVTYYQNLNAYLSLENNEASYDTVKQYIKDENVVYAIVNSDITKAVNFADSKYKICTIPNLNASLKSRTLSTTSVACVNSQSNNKSEADLFAAFLSYEYAPNMKDISGKHSARSTIDRLLADEEIIYKQYADSKAVPKILEYGDFWANSQIAFEQIWDGQDVSEVLKDLTTKIKEY